MDGFAERERSGGGPDGGASTGYSVGPLTGMGLEPDRPRTNASGIGPVVGCFWRNANGWPSMVAKPAKIGAMPVSWRGSSRSPSSVVPSSRALTGTGKVASSGFVPPAVKMRKESR